MGRCLTAQHAMGMSCGSGGHGIPHKWTTSPLSSISLPSLHIAPPSSTPPLPFLLLFLLHFFPFHSSILFISPSSLLPSSVIPPLSLSSHSLSLSFLFTPFLCSSFLLFNLCCLFLLGKSYFVRSIAFEIFLPLCGMRIPPFLLFNRKGKVLGTRLSLVEARRSLGAQGEHVSRLMGS